MFKAESNIVTDHGVIKNGETFNPDHFKIASKDIDRWISIGLVSKIESRLEPETAGEAITESDASVVDTDDRRKHSRKATK